MSATTTIIESSYLNLVNSFKNEMVKGAIKNVKDISNDQCFIEDISYNLINIFIQCTIY